MSAPPPELVAFHVAFVVRQMQAAQDWYRRLLGVERWHHHDMHLASVPWDDRTTESHVQGAYGRGAGLTIELLQPVDGVCLYSQFLEAHGEGVQHIGFWSPDVLGSVEHAVAEGAQVSLAYFDAPNTAVVQLAPNYSSSAIVEAMRVLPPRTAYVGAQANGVQLEFCGPATSRFLRDWLKEDFAAWLTPPPWEA